MSDRAREVDIASSRRLARVMDDAVTVPREVERQPLREPPSTAYVLGAAALMVVPVLAGVAVTVLGIWLLVRWLT